MHPKVAPTKCTERQNSEASKITTVHVKYMRNKTLGGVLLISDREV